MLELCLVSLGGSPSGSGLVRGVEALCRGEGTACSHVAFLPSQWVCCDSLLISFVSEYLSFSFTPGGQACCLYDLLMLCGLCGFRGKLSINLLSQ